MPAVQRMATRWQVGPRDDWTSGRQRAGGCLDGAGALGQLPWCRGALPHRSFNSELSLNVRNTDWGQGASWPVQEDWGPDQMRHKGLPPTPGLSWE